MKPIVDVARSLAHRGVLRGRAASQGCTPMPFLQLTLDIGRAEPEPCEDVLFDLGALSVTLEDAADDPVLEPAPGETPLWPTIRIKALFAGRCRSRRDPATRSRTACPTRAAPRFEAIADKAWEREWLKDFGPMRFGRRLWVCPGGLPAGGPDAVRIELDPGLAFGTGTHPTTACASTGSTAHDLAGRDVVDYGCGCGILAIAALKLGAARGAGRGHRPAGAHRHARERACATASCPDLTVTGDPALPDRAADLLIANILAGPLVELAPRFAAAVRPGRLDRAERNARRTGRRRDSRLPAVV